MPDFLTLKSPAFGIDISSSSLKIVKLKKKRKGFALASFGEQKIKPGIIERGEVKDEEALIKVIKEGVSKIKGEKLRTKHVVCSLPEERSFLQVIQMPKLKKEELERAVKYEAENHIPLPIDEVYLDSQIIPPIYNHLDHSDILVIAFPKKVIDPYIYCLKKAGLQPRILELESSAVTRALIKKEVTTYSLVLVDIGEAETSFIVFAGYSLRFTSAISISSHKFTEAIARDLKVDLEEAEKLKSKYNLKNKESQNKKILEILTPLFGELSEEIKKRLDYYRTHRLHEHLPPDHKGIQKILLCGGGANLKGIDSFLSGQLKVPVKLGNPWVNILPEPQKETSRLPYNESLRYTVALGLALRGAREKND
jgi:type IV pilus assembly protein PilM